MGSRAFIAAPAPHASKTQAIKTLPAVLSATAMTMPNAAHAAEAAAGSVWIPALSAVGAGFAIGLAAIALGLARELPRAAALMASVASQKLQMICEVCCFCPWHS